MTERSQREKSRLRRWGRRILPLATAAALVPLAAGCGNPSSYPRDAYRDGGIAADDDMQGAFGPLSRYSNGAVTKSTIEGDSTRTVRTSTTDGGGTCTVKIVKKTTTGYLMSISVSNSNGAVEATMAGSPNSPFITEVSASPTGLRRTTYRVNPPAGSGESPLTGTEVDKAAKRMQDLLGQCGITKNPQ